MFDRTSSFLLLFCILVPIGLISCNRSSDYLSKGNKAFASSRYDDAIINYRNAIQSDPKSGEAHYRLGLAVAGTGDRLEALRSLLTARTLLPERDDIAIKCADLEMDILMTDPGRPQRIYQDLAETSDKFLAKNPASFEGLSIKGQLAWLDKKNDLAVSFLDKANAVRPMDPHVILLWSQILFQEKRGLEGEKLALSLITAQKTYGPIYDVLFRYYQATNRSVEAENILKTKVESNPRQIEFALQLASFYGAAGRNEEVRTILSRLTGDTTTFPDEHLRVGDFFAARQNWTEAVREYKEGAKTDTANRITILKRIADVALSQGKAQEAAEVVAEILKASPKDEAARAVNAAILVNSGKAENVDQGAKELSDLVARSPENPVWRLNLGLALTAKGDVDAAAAQFKAAIAKREDFLPPRLALAELSYLKRDYQETLRYSDELLALSPPFYDALLMRAVALTGLRRYNDARRELTNLERRYPAKIEIQFQSIVLDVSQKQFAEAERRLKKLSSDPGSATRTLEAFLTVYGGQNRLDKAFTLLSAELEKSPGSDVVRSLLAGTALRMGRYDQALAMYQELLRKSPQSSQLHRLIGAAYEAKGERDKAIANFEQAKNLAPEDPAAVAGLADLLRMRGRSADAIAGYRLLLQLDPENPSAMNNLAYLLAESGGNLDEAEGLVQRALHRVPADANYTDTLGIIYGKKKRNDKAVHLFETLVAKHPDEPLFRYHYGLALRDDGRQSQAKSEFETALRKSPPPDLRASIDSALASIK